MFIKFTLTMPNVGSWDGRWSGEGKEYSQVRKYTKKYSKEKIKNVLSKSAYFYNFGDGWSANIRVDVVDAIEKNKSRKRSLGFNDYDWMIDSIEKVGKIIVESEESNEKEYEGDTNQDFNYMSDMIGDI